MKRVLILVFLTAIVGCAVMAGTKESFSDAQKLIEFFQSTTENPIETEIELTADLDFSSSTLTLPLGKIPMTPCVPYGGVFHGNGHSIKGLQMKGEGNDNAGLFCRLQNAIIENLVIDSSCFFT